MPVKMEDSRPVPPSRLHQPKSSSVTQADRRADVWFVERRHQSFLSYGLDRFKAFVPAPGMSELGQPLQFCDAPSMSAYPPIAAVLLQRMNGRKVPTADIATQSKAAWLTTTKNPFLNKVLVSQVKRLHRGDFGELQ